MSLIVDVNPVPWKILELVRARILKNRAKKKKVDQGFSATAIRREINAQQGLLAKRRLEEPSFLIQEGKYGVGWLHIGQNYTVTSNFTEATSPAWSNGVPGDTWYYDLPGTEPTTYRSDTSTFFSASLELVITVGIGSGEAYRQARHTLNFSYSASGFDEETWSSIEDVAANTYFYKHEEQSLSTGTNNFSARLWYGLFPAGNSSTVLVVSIVQFSRSTWLNDTGVVTTIGTVQSSQTTVVGGASSLGSVSAQSTKQISFLITESSITELTHSLPIFIQKEVNRLLALEQETTGTVIGLRSDLSNPLVTEARLASLGIYSGSPPWDLRSLATSSVIFETIASDGTFLNITPQQAKASYAAFSGNTEIPVLGYKRDDPSAAITPTTERGVFGIIPGASVTAPVTAEMLAAGLDDEQVQEPGPNAENRTEPVFMIVAYDYHGGTYCRDQLAALGITLP
jgi:hypothetical protein